MQFRLLKLSSIKTRFMTDPSFIGLIRFNSLEVGQGLFLLKFGNYDFSLHGNQLKKWQCIKMDHLTLCRSILVWGRVYVNVPKQTRRYCKQL